MKTWRAAAPERIVPGIDMRLPGTPGVSHVAARSPKELRELHARGVFQVLGEVMAQYEGVRADNPRPEPYWALAEELDIPVGIHLGPGEPGQSYGKTSGYRARNGSPLVLEDVLVRHPKLLVYIMHAGYPFAEDLRALLFSHPQVYVDIASIVYTEPRPAFYRFLEKIVEAGYGDRVMFGSDQMIWPGVIEPSIAAIKDAPFLSAEARHLLQQCRTLPAAQRRGDCATPFRCELSGLRLRRRKLTSAWCWKHQKKVCIRLVTQFGFGGGNQPESAFLQDAERGEVVFRHAGIKRPG